jgi:hypothetical protein
MRITFSDVANAVVIATCLVFVGNMLFHRADSRSPVGAYPAGSRIQDSPELGFKAAERTLILVTSSSCRFCTVGLPFYRELVTVAKRRGTRVLAVTPELPSTNRAFLETGLVIVDASLSIAQSHIAVTQTPYVILVHRDGTVIESWSGQLSVEKERKS